MAMAPQQLGIGIRRRFTRPGVDPYDTVEWERRDARIPNYKDGGDAFFQPGVEFPDDLVAERHQHRRPEVLPRHARHARARVVAAPGHRPGRRHDRRLGRRATATSSTSDEAEAFRDELKYVLVHQRASFNSPVWFNIGVKGVPQQACACFILAVDDTMDAILNWYREEGIIFKGGSGAGINLSRIRSSHEHLKGGGTASGPVSFMRGADASAGTIKSGGKTRRAAKMVILDVDHPDIEDFVWCKAVEERKARALRDAGFDMDLDGKDSHSIQYQNANNSVRVTDEFMQAVVDDRDWDLKRGHDRRAGQDGAGPRPHAPDRASRRGSAPTRACSSTPRSTAGTPRRTPAGSTRATRAREYMHLDNSACNLASINLLHVPRTTTAASTSTGSRTPSRSCSPRRRSSSATPTTRPSRSRETSRRVPPARPRLRQPRRAADGAGHALRLRRRPGLGRGDHRADDRATRTRRAHAPRPHGPVRGLRREPASRCSTCCGCTAPRRPRSTRTSSRPSCCAPRRRRGTTRSSSASATACATRRPPCSRRPAPSA